MVEVTEWFEPSAIPNHGVPVMAEYYPFNTRSNALAQQVVWFWEGEYRLYPQTTGTAYVERWAHLPSYQQSRIEALEAALRRIKDATANEMRAGDKGYVSRYGIHGIATKALESKP